jgi:phage terminase large subunit
MPSDGVLAADLIRSYREPPYGAIKFMREQLHAEPDPWQAKLLEAYISRDPQHRRISMQACAGPGKTAGEVVCGLHFLSCMLLEEGQHPKGLATSITGDNLRDNLWSEFAKWQSRSPFLSSQFTWSAQRIYATAYPATWFIAARTWPRGGSADEQGRTLAGLHSRSILFLIDESGAIPATVLRATEQGLANTAFGKVLQAGNPISLEGCLHEAAVRLRGQWFIIRVTGDPDDPEAWVHAPRVANVPDGEQSPAEWAREQIRTYGHDNPWVKSYILGQFPPGSINALLGPEDVEAAMQRHLTPDQYATAQKRIGVDIARFGDDRTVIYARQGLNASVPQPVILRNASTVDVATRILLAKSRYRSEMDFVDAGAMGAGVIDQLRAASITVQEVHFGGAANDPTVYRNRRAEMWFRMAKAIKAGAALSPFCQELLPELTTTTYQYLNGVFQLEDKAFVKKRLGRSPDIADALALTYALPDMPSVQMQRAAHVERSVQQPVDFDPFRPGA